MAVGPIAGFFAAWCFRAEARVFGFADLCDFQGDSIGATFSDRTFAWPVSGCPNQGGLREVQDSPGCVRNQGSIFCSILKSYKNSNPNNFLARASYWEIFWEWKSDMFIYAVPKNIAVSRTRQKVIRVWNFVGFQNRSTKTNPAPGRPHFLHRF